MIKQENLWLKACQNGDNEKVKRFWIKIAIKNDFFVENYSFSQERGIKCLICKKDCFVWKKMFNLKNHRKNCTNKNNIPPASIDEKTKLPYNSSFSLRNSLEETVFMGNVVYLLQRNGIQNLDYLVPIIKTPFSSGEFFNNNLKIASFNSITPMMPLIATQYLEADTNKSENTILSMEIDKKFMKNNELNQIYVHVKSQNEFIDVKKNKHKKSNLNRIVNFLEYCNEFNLQVTSSVVERYVENLRFRKKIEGSYSLISHIPSTKNKIKKILNKLLKKEERLKIPKLQFGAIDRIFKEEMKKVPSHIRHEILEKLEKIDYELYKAVLISYWICPRISELVKLQMKHFLKIEFPKEQWYVFYYQSKTKTEKITMIPEEVFKLVSQGKNSEDFCIIWQRAGTLSDYFKKVCRENKIPFYPFHCWRHTKTTEIQKQGENPSTEIHLNKEFKEFLKAKAQINLGHSEKSRSIGYYQLFLNEFELGLKDLIRKGKKSSVDKLPFPLIGDEEIRCQKRLKR